MYYDKLLAKWKRKLFRFANAADKAFANRTFSKPDNDVFYLNIENAIRDLIKAIVLWEDAVDYKKENPR